MAKSSTSYKKGDRANPGGRPPLTDAERKAREMLTAATPHAVQRIIREILEDGPLAVKCAEFVIEHRLGKAPAAEEDRDALRPLTLGVADKAELFALARGEVSEGDD